MFTFVFLCLFLFIDLFQFSKKAAKASENGCPVDVHVLLVRESVLVGWRQNVDLSSSQCQRTVKGQQSRAQLPFSSGSWIFKKQQRPRPHLKWRSSQGFLNNTDEQRKEEEEDRGGLLFLSAAVSTLPRCCCTATQRRAAGNQQRFHCEGRKTVFRFPQRC